LKKITLQLFRAENVDVQLYKFFSACRYIAQTAIVKIRIDSPKRLAMNKFVRTKSPTGGKFSKIFFEQLYAGWTVVVHLYCGFLCGVRWRHNRAPNFEARFSVIFSQFEEG